MPDKTMTNEDYCWCGGILFEIFVLSILLVPENLIKKKDNKYFLETNDYFDRYIKNEKKIEKIN